MRADAFVTLKLVHPLRKLFPAKGRRVPILMYHSISDAEEGGHPYFRTVTHPAVFGRQMANLKEWGYTTLSPAGALRWLAGEEAVERPVVLTFDDGYADFHRNAFPELSRHGFSATVYLPTAYIGGTTQRFRGVDCLTWGQVKKLHQAGIEFGSHTVTHRQMQGLGTEEVRQEVQASKERIEQELGCAVESFSYPYKFPEADGDFTGRLRGLLAEAGYENGVTTILGTADGMCDPLMLTRLPVNACDDEKLLAAKLATSYDWLHGLQLTTKVLELARSRRRD